MGEKNVEMLKQFVQEMQGQQVNPDSSFKQMEEVIARLHEGLMEVGSALQQTSMELNLCRQSLQMVFNIFADKGIMTKEEVQERYTNEVVIPIRKAMEELRAKMEAEAKAPIEIKGAIRDLKEEEEEEASNVVLPSEKHKVVRFDDE